MLVFRTDPTAIRKLSICCMYLLALEFQPHTMGFVVLPALPADISNVYDVYFAAFKDNAITRALFPSASANDMTDSESEFRYVI